MASYFWHNTSFTKLIIIVEFFLVAYLLYSLTKNVYNSYQVDKYIESFQEENQLLEQENKRKNEDYLYFTSEEYIDKIAKQNLGLVNPGEEVVVVAPESLNTGTGSTFEDSSSLDDYSSHEELSNPQKWLRFFFN